MKKLIILILLLSGCSSVPQKPSMQRHFPDAPKYVTEKCPDMETIPEDEKQFSNAISTVVNNYLLYQECKIKVDMWNEWYNIQKKNFDNL